MPEPRQPRMRKDQYNMSTVQVQPDGSQIVEMSPIAPPTSRRPPDKRENERFALVYPDALPGILAMPLNNNDLRVLIALVVDMDFNGPWRPFHKALTEAAGIPYPSWHASLRRLKDSGVVFDFPNREILLNPTMFWKGDRNTRWEWVLRLRNAGRLPARFTPEIEES